MMRRCTNYPSRASGAPHAPSSTWLSQQDHRVVAHENAILEVIFEPADKAIEASAQTRRAFGFAGSREHRR